MSSTATFDMYMGQLFPIEDYRTYGAYTNTHNKVIVVCENATTEPSGIKDTILALTTAFANAVQNPFQPAGMPLVSKALDTVITQIVQKHNSAYTKRKL